MPTVARKTKTVARKTVARKTAVKAKPWPSPLRQTKPAAKAKAPAVVKGLTQAQIVAKSVPAIVKSLKSGTTMTDIRSQYGAGSVIRKALADAGYNTKGEKVTVEPINGSGAVLAKRVAAARADGRAWWNIELATGKTEIVLRDLLNENGYGELAEGRVVREQEDKPKPARKTVAKKTTAKAKPAAKAPARKAAAKPKAKTTAKAGVKPGRRVRRANPSSAA